MSRGNRSIDGIQRVGEIDDQSHGSRGFRPAARRPPALC